MRRCLRGRAQRQAHGRVRKGVPRLRKGLPRNGQDGEVTIAFERGGPGLGAISRGQRFYGDFQRFPRRGVVSGLDSFGNPGGITMLPSTTARVPLNTSEQYNKAIRRQMVENVSRYANATPAEI